jgi:hypothetical protein
MNNKSIDIIDNTEIYYNNIPLDIRVNIPYEDIEIKNKTSITNKLKNIINYFFN